VFIEGHSIAFELFGVPGHGGRLPFFPARLSWISGVHQKGVRSGIGPTLGWLALTLIVIGVLIALMTWMLSQAAPGIAHLVEEYRRNHPRKETNH
ncbi:hypothetical protein ACL1GI_12975, partial [Corynebacterium striatum]